MSAISTFQSNEELSDPSGDLSEVLRHIGAGRLAGTRRKLANSWETRAFLEIGLELLREDLLEYSGPDLDSEDRSRLFESLSRERILGRAAQWQEQDQEKLLTVNMYRGRWEHKNRFTEDLIAYLFRLAPQQRRLDHFERACLAMMGEVSLGQLVRRLSTAVSTMLVNDQLSALQHSIETALPRHPQVQEFSKAQYDLILPRWAAIYRRIGEAYGFGLRPGTTWDDVAIIFNALTQGYMFKSRSSVDALRLSSGEDLLAGSILLLIQAMADLPDREDLNTRFARPRQ